MLINCAERKVKVLISKIAVVMGTYNERIADLRMAIESILNQTYKEIEFIIILDNPNNHEHEELIRKYQLQDSRIRFYINEKNIGLALSLNRAINLTRCEVIARMDADDISLPERLEKEYIYLIEHPEYRMVSVNKEVIDANNKTKSFGEKLPTDFEVIKKAMNYVNVVLHPGAMFYRHDILELKGYRNFPTSQDYDLWLRYILSGKKFGFLDECLIRYRISDNNTSVKKSMKQWYCHKYIMKLANERKVIGTDSFSESDLNTYFEKNGCNNADIIEKFKKGCLLRHEARCDLEKRELLKASLKIGRAIISHKEILLIILNSIRYKQCMKGSKSWG